MVVNFYWVLRRISNLLGIFGLVLNQLCPIGPRPNWIAGVVFQHVAVVSSDNIHFNALSLIIQLTLTLLFNESQGTFIPNENRLHVMEEITSRPRFRA